jgi:hypothetical protein
MRKEVVNEGDMTGQRLMGDHYENFGRKHYLGGEDCISCLAYFLVLGVLGSGARNPHGILELGSWIGCS